MNKAICGGTRTQTDSLSGTVLCPTCHRTHRTGASGKILPHYVPQDCDRLVYRNRWPERCSHKAVDGSQFCGTHSR